MAKVVHIIRNSTSLYCGARFHFTTDGTAIITSTKAATRVMWPYQMKPDMIAKPCKNCQLAYDREQKK